MAKSSYPSASPKILLIGGESSVGREVAAARWPTGWEVRTLSRDQLNITDPADLAAAIANGDRGEPWSAVINCATYGAIRRSQGDLVMGWMINALAPAAIGEACARSSTPLVQVFADTTILCRDRTNDLDTIAPVNVHDGSLAGGELAIRESGARHAIVRASLLMSAEPGKLLGDIIHLAQSKLVTRVVDQSFGSPTGVTDLAQAVSCIAVRLVTDTDAPVGTFNFANRGEVGWAKFVLEIFRQVEHRTGHRAGLEIVGGLDHLESTRWPSQPKWPYASASAAFEITARAWHAAISESIEVALTSCSTS